ncbi:MAG TPA: protease inhibitor I9 family protein, partial [Candidatus Methanoperedens sp.]
MEKRNFILKAALYFCVIIMILSGTALAVDRDVIIGYHKPVGDPENKNIQSHGGKVKKDFHLINAISARVPENKIDELKKDPGIEYIVNDSIFKAADEYSSAWGVQYIG